MTFAQRFIPSPDHVGRVGMELEYFVRNLDGLLNYGGYEHVEALKSHLPHLGVGYELSAAQVELCNPVPLQLSSVRPWLKLVDQQIAQTARALGIILAAEAYIDDILPIVTPLGRPAEIAAMVTDKNLLQAACSVASFQVKIGVDSIDAGIAVVNCARNRRDALVSTYMSEARARAYATFASRGTMALWFPHLRDREHLNEVAEAWGFADNPKNCHTLVRIHAGHGAVEFRFADATACLKTRMQCVADCIQICVDALGSDFRRRALQ